MLLLNMLKSKKPMQKKLSKEKGQKNGVFDLYYYVQKFSAYTFFGWTFLNFFQRIRTEENEKHIL